MGKSLHAQLRALCEEWGATKDDRALVEAVHALSEQFGEEKTAPPPTKRPAREDLEPICSEHLCS